MTPLLPMEIVSAIRKGCLGISKKAGIAQIEIFQYDE